MNADAETQQQTQEGQQTGVAGVSPAKGQPHVEGAAEHRRGVDLALDSREPYGVAEEIAERPHRSAEGSHAEETQRGAKQPHRHAATEHGEGIAQRCHKHRIAEREEHEEMREKLINRCSRRMSHTERPARGDKLATVPPRSRAVHGEEIDQRRESKKEKGEMADAPRQQPSLNPCTLFPFHITS